MHLFLTAWGRVCVLCSPLHLANHVHALPNEPEKDTVWPGGARPCHAAAQGCRPVCFGLANRPPPFHVTLLTGLFLLCSPGRSPCWIQSSGLRVTFPERLEGPPAPAPAPAPAAPRRRQPACHSPRAPRLLSGTFVWDGW